MTASVIKGTTRECFQHFSKTYGPRLVADKFRIRHAISDLVGVSRVTGYRWFGKSQLSIGVYFLKTQLLLESMGYTINERKNLLWEQRELADQLALSLVSIKDIARAMSVVDDTILPWAMGKSRPIQKTLMLLGSNLKQREKVTEEGRKHWHETLKNLGLVSVKEPASKPLQEVAAKPVSTEPSSVTPVANNEDRTEAVEVLAHLILAAKPLATKILSDDFTAEDRTLLRELTGDGRSNGVFDLSNLLNRLCGERARNEIPSHKPQGA